jgi:hypothetical protein
VLEDDEVDPITSQHPPADISPAEFEEFVVQLLKSIYSKVDDLIITPHDKVTGADGTYDFDVTVRFRVGDFQFYVLVEAKRHKNPIKRDLVMVLNQKKQSVGAHKGMMFSTAPYQKGARKSAMKHGIGLATVTEGRFTVAARAEASTPPMSRAQALEEFGIPTFVGFHYGPGREPGPVIETLLSPEYPEDVVEMLTGQPMDNPEDGSGENGGRG